jgi:hypothetical protein
VKGRCRAVGEHGLRAVAEDCGHPVAALGEAAVADGVDAAVDAGQAAGGHSVPDGACAQAEKLQLGKGDQVVLALRQQSDLHVPRGCVTLRRTYRRNVLDPLHCPQFSRQTATGGRRVLRVGYETAATPWCSATTSTMSPIIRLTSKSLGV